MASYELEVDGDELCVSIVLPGISSAAVIDIDASDDGLCLDAPPHSLQLIFPVDVDSDECAAKFDKATHQLTLRFPVQASVPIGPTLAPPRPKASEETSAAASHGPSTRPPPTATPAWAEPSSQALQGELSADVLELVTKRCLQVKERLWCQRVCQSWCRMLKALRWSGRVDVTSAVLTKVHREGMGPRLAKLLDDGVKAGAAFEGRIGFKTYTFGDDIELRICAYDTENHGYFDNSNQAHNPPRRAVLCAQRACVWEWVL